MNKTVLGMETLINAMEVKKMAKKNNVLTGRVLGEDLTSVIELKKDEDQIVNLTNAYNIIGALAKLGYVAGSKIGQIISLTCVCETLKDIELNKQFLIEGSRKQVDLFKLSLVFPYLNTAENKIRGYESVFTEDEFAEVTDRNNRTQTILLACKDKIKDFSDRLKEIAYLELEDLLVIGRDLEIVATVMSELEIDAAKNEKKREGMIDISEFMNEFMTQNSRKFKMFDNFDTVKEAKRMKDNDPNKDYAKLELELKTKPSLFEYEDVLKKLQDEHMQALYNGEIPEHDEEDLPDVALSMCAVRDPLYTMNEELLNVMNIQMNKLGDIYNNSDNDLFKGFDVMPERDETLNKFKDETPEQSVIAIKKIAILVYDMISSTYKFKNYMSMSKVEEIATIGRNIIYTAATDRGISLADAFYLGVDAAWLKVVNGKINPRGYFRYKACEAVFGNELKCHFNAEAMCKEVEVEIPEELFEVEDLFINNKLFNFENGSCEIEGLDGEYYSILRLDNINFTGKVLVKIDEEGYLAFMEQLNPYVYERVSFFALNSISNMLIDANKFSAEEMAKITIVDAKERYAFTNAYKKAKVIDTVRYNAKEADVLAYANNIAPVLNAFDNITKFAVTMSERFSIAPDVRREHIYMKDATNGAVRMVGSLVNFSIDKPLKDCSDMKIVSTPIGALIVVK